MNLPRIFRCCLAAASLASSILMAPFAGAAVAFHIDGNGMLTGASGIAVGQLPGTYSVDFVDGTCIGLFGCTSANFTFHDQATADSASTALLSLVFVDSAAHPFDSHPELTAGCSFFQPLTCNVLTPFAFDDSSGIVSSSNAQNRVGTSFLSLSTLFGFVDSTPNPGEVWAVWRIDPTSPVPEPGILAMLSLGSAVLVWTQRRRRPETRIQ